MAGSGLYLIAVAIYLVFFGLFVRFFIWKRYADRTYWQRRPRLDLRLLEEVARARGKTLPRFSVIIPARNEADVIARTIEHMNRLCYPVSLYEVVVATDEKERLAREDIRPRVIAAAEASLRGEPEPAHFSAQARMLVTDLLASLGQEHWQPDSRLGQALGWEGTSRLPWVAERGLVRELAWTILQSRGKINAKRLLFLVRRAYNGSPPDLARRAYPCYLAAALPVVLAYVTLTRGPVPPVRARLRRLVPRSLWPLAGTVARRIVRETVRLRRRGQLRRMLEDLFPACFPTTQDVVEAKIRELRGREAPRVRQVEVPYDFEGRLGGELTGRLVPSTKGRALNYALGFVDPASDMCAFYDAESRPDPRVLMYVAYRWLTDPRPPAIFQGPVFQVRNFYEMGPVCKVAALYQAVAHDWYLPVLFRRLPFVGGTNLVVDRHLLESIGGFDPQCLTEDLELGVRAYLEAGVWPEYLPYPSSEQTPPTVKAFFRQRLRWGTGHLLVMDKVRSEQRYEREKKERLLHTLFLKGQVEWTLYQLATFVPPAILLLFVTGHLDVSAVPGTIRHALNVMSAVYVGFTFYTYRRYSTYVDSWSCPWDWTGRVWIWLQLLILPLAAFLFPTPYATALVLKKLGKHPRTWTKTPRSRE